MSKKNKKIMQRIEVGNYLVRDPEIYHGELTFKGTRVPVDVVLGYIATGLPPSEVPEHWPDVTTEAVLEALSFAKQALIEKYIMAA